MDLWRAVSTITWNTDKSLIDVFNGSGSGRILRIQRVWILNTNFIASSNLLSHLELRRTDASGTTPVIVPISNDSAAQALPAQVTVGIDRSTRSAGVLRRILWATSIFAFSSSNIQNLECLIPFGEVWNAGYSDADVQKLTLREGEGFDIKQTGTSTAGWGDFEIEFTNEAP